MASDPASERSPAPPRVSVSVVTYNSASHLPGFLASLRGQTGVSWDAVFFDNASHDDTRDIVQAAGLGPMTSSGANVGYGRGHNDNFAQCRGAYFLVLNPDLQFGSTLFADLVRYLDEHAEYAIAGPAILEGPAKRPFPPRRFYPGEGMVALDPALRRSEIAWLSGCCLMIRRSTFEALGGFDAGYFLYQEDTDLCLRARRAGHRIGHLPSSDVHHLHRQSQRELSEYALAQRIFEGSLIFFQKHYAWSDTLRMVRFQDRVASCLLVLGPIRRRLHGLRHVLTEPRLRARRDVCLEWLDRQRRHRIGLAGVPGTIALRQCRLAVEWLRQGKFPLDDY